MPLPRRLGGAAGHARRMRMHALDFGLLLPWLSRRCCPCLPTASPQVHGAAGVSDVTPLAHMWAGARTLRLADGPDVVHLETIAKLELAAARRSRL